MRMFPVPVLSRKDISFSFNGDVTQSDISLFGAGFGASSITSSPSISLRRCGTWIGSSFGRRILLAVGLCSLLRSEVLLNQKKVKLIALPGVWLSHWLLLRLAAPRPTKDD